MGDAVTPEAINRMMKERWPAAPCTCLDVGPSHAVAALAPSAADLRPGGHISGPALFAAADAALWFLCFGASGRLLPLALTADLTIRFLRPARGERVIARAELNRAGPRSVVGTVTIWTEDPEAPCAVAQGAYVLPRGS